jgi:hypothetical protein
MPRREGLRWASLGYLEWADQNKMRTCLRHGAEDFLLPGRNSTFVTRRVGRGNSTGVCVVCVGGVRRQRGARYDTRAGGARGAISPRPVFPHR